MIYGYSWIGNNYKVAFLLDRSATGYLLDMISGTLIWEVQNTKEL